MRRVFAVLALAALVVGDELEALVAGLGAEDAGVRAAAAARLRAAGARALPLLERARAAGDPEVRRVASELVLAIRADLLRPRLEAGDVGVREEALEELWGRADAPALLAAWLGPDLAPALADVLRYDLDPDRRQAAIELLARLGPPESLPGLAWALHEQVGHGSTGVAPILAEQGDPRVLPDLVAAAERGVPGAREAAERIRGRFPGARVPGRPLADPVPYLARVREAESPAARVRALRALLTGMLHDPRAALAATGALRDAEPSVRRWAARAFSYLPAQPEPLLMALVRKDPDRLVRLEACVALRRGRALFVVPFLLDVAGRHEDAELRRAAASALGDAGGPDAAEILLGLAASETDAATARQMRDSAARMRERE